MNKNDTTVNVNDVLAALEAASNKKSGKKLSTTKKYTVQTGVIQHYPPQMRVLIGILLQNPGTHNEVELFGIIESYPEITEKQTPWQIFAFYRKQLIEAGWIVVG